MKSNSVAFAVCLLVVHQLVVPAYSQSIQSRHYRPHPNKCDRNGRCSPKEGYIEEADHDEDDKSDKDRPPVLTRDDWPTRPHVSEPDKDEKLGGGRPSGGYGGGYNPKPVIDREDVKPVVTRTGGGYTKPSGSRDDDTKPDIRPTGGGGGYGGGYNPKPVVDRDDDLKPIRPSGGGGGGYGGGYNPKPVDKDEDIKPIRVRPGGGGGYGGGYNPKPVIDEDDDIKPDVRPTGDGYNPKPIVDKDDDLKPIRPSGGGGGGGYGGGYNPKPVDKDEDIKPIRVRPGGGGGYGGGYNPKPAVDRDDDLKPLRPGTGGGYDPKPVDRDDYDVKPIEKDGAVGRPVGGYIPKPGGVRGGYNPKPDVDDYVIKPIRPGGYPDDDRKPDKEDHGGYNKQKDDDYNVSDKDDVSDYDYGGDDKPIPVVDGNCICVPYYQCKDGHIVTDGGGIIDARKRPDPEEELPLDGKFQPPSCGPFHVCCNTPESSTVKPYEHRCGVRNPSGINSRILSPSNKGEADFGEWPWQAAVLKSEGKVNIFQCGGVLIDKYHVLTVAHCVFHLYQFNEYPLKVRLGEWDTQTTTEFLAHEDYRVSKIIVHPEYRNTSLWNDVAVLRLQDPVLFAPHIDTVCLPQYDEVFGGQNCVVTGWGKDAYKGGTFSNVMKEVALQVIDNYKCEEMLRKTRLGRFFQLHEGFLCAGGEYGLDSCKGDGGGPLVCYRKDKSYALAGIVSWGIDCGQPGVPGVYVKIQKYLEWISKTTGVTLQEYWPKQ